MIFAHHLGLLVRAEHKRNVGTVDVSIEQADAVAHLAERERQVDGKRGFANSTFAGTNGDDGVNAGQGLRAGLLLAGMMGMSAHMVLFQSGRGSGRRFDYTGRAGFKVSRFQSFMIVLSPNGVLL
jgi:hypothetical protein